MEQSNTCKTPSFRRIVTTLIISIVASHFIFSQQNVGIGTDNPDASALLEMVSTDKGILIPRMTTTERVAISSPANGLLVFDNNLNTFWYFNGSSWEEIKKDNLGDHIASMNLDLSGNHILNAASLDLEGSLLDKDGEAGNPDQVLATTGSGTDWVDATGGATEIDELSDGLTLGSSLFLGEQAGINDDATNNMNTALGYYSLKMNTSGFHNIGLGSFTLRNNTTGADNIAIGANSMFTNTIGYSNIAIGRESLLNNLEGYGNTAIGVAAMLNNDDGHNNTALGYIGLQNNTSGDNNLALGAQALGENTIGNGNTALGTSALCFHNEGDNNLAVGTLALASNISGENNLAIGSYAGRDATGDGNIFIGHQAGYTETGNGKLYIANSATTSPLIYGDFTNNYLKIHGSLAIRDTLFDSNDEEGISGQVLSSTGGGTDWIDLPLGDNLGNHFATQELNLNGNNIALQGGWLANDGGNEGVYVDASGKVGINKFPTYTLDVNGNINATDVVTSNFHLSPMGTTGFVLTSDGTNSSWQAPALDNLGNHIATEDLQLSGFEIALGGGWISGDGDEEGLFVENANGNVGIGTSNVTNEKLYVNGNIRVSGKYLDYGNQAGLNGQLLQSTGTATEWVDKIDEIDELTDGKTGGNSVFLGENAGGNDDGSDNKNVGIGINALQNTSSGEQNTGVGFNVLQANVDGGQNTAFGNETMATGSSGHQNAAFGFYALHSNNADDNAAFGTYALSSNTSGIMNTGIGRAALDGNTLGSSNTALGAWTLSANQSGSSNTAIGTESMEALSTGSDNTAIGYQTGYINNGEKNIFIGYKAGYNESGDNKLYIENSDSNSPLIWGDFSYDYVEINGSLRVTDTLFDSSIDAGLPGQLLSSTGYSTDWIQPTISHLADGKAFNYSTFLGEESGTADDGTFNQNTALGYQAMKFTNSGMGNTAEGYRSLYSNTSGDYNTAIGNEALLTNENGFQNTALGHHALFSNTSGNYNTALGNLSLESNIDGSQNSALGNGALYNNTIGSSNTAVGDNAMVSNMSGGSNSALGENALNANQSGAFNVALGAKAGYGATGNSNVFIGNEAGYSETGDNKLYIENSNSAEPLIWGDFTSNEVKINGSLTVTNHFRDTDGFAAGNGELLFGTSLGTTWRFAAINDLTNGITDENSTYLGNGAGVSDDLTNNKNTGVGHQSLNGNITGEFNIANGYRALFTNTTGSYNSAMGNESLYYNNGGYNTASGSHSLYNNTTGSFNTAFGFGALSYNKGNWGSVAIGYNAMYNANNTTSTNYTYNTAVGYEALKGSSSPSSNTGISNTSIGHQTLFSNSSGNYNTATGAGALFNNSIGSSNTAIGNGALYSNKANSGSTAIGHNALYYANDNISGITTANTAIGFEALKGGTLPSSNTGIYNTTVGYQSLFSNTSGDNNTSMGLYALYSNTTGDNNTAIGDYAGFYTTGSSNVFLGHNAGYYEYGSNKLYIDNSNTGTPLIWGDFSNDQVIINGGFQATGTIKDSWGSTGNYGQVLSSTATGTSWINFPPGDNLGNHYATQDIVMASTEIALNGGYISGDGDDEGLTVNSSGMVGVGTPNPSQLFEVYGYSSGGVGHFTNTASSDFYGVYGQCSAADYYGYGGYFKGGFKGVQGVVNPTGSSTYYGVFGEVSGGSGNNYGIYGSASGSGTNYAGYFSGNVHVTGTLSKGSGSFKIDHPLEPDKKYLSHSFVESPDMMNVYNGNIITDENGLATVDLPDWFETLNKDFRYQLTVIGEFAQAIVFEKIKENSFSIKTDKPEIEVSWQVTGIRQDKYANAHRIQVEEYKNEDETGKYLHPELFGKSKELGIGYVANKKIITAQNKFDNLSK